MKTKILLLCFTIIVIIIFNGCGKKEERRLTNSWKFVKAFQISPNKDYTNNYKNEYIEFKTDGTYLWEDNIGKWSLVNNDEEIILIPDNHSYFDHHFTIIRLKKNELWFKEKWYDTELEYHLSSK